MHPNPPDYSLLKSADLPLNTFINLGFQITKRRWQVLLGLYCVLLLPVSFAEYICKINDVSTALVLVLGVGTQLFYTSFCALIVEAEVRGADMPNAALLAYGSKRFVPALITLALLALILLVATLALIVPGIVLGIGFQFGVLVAVTRNQVGINALKYSLNLVKGRWWFTLGCTIMFSFVVPLAVGLPFMLLLSGADPASAKSMLASNIIGGLASVPGNVMLVLVFLNFDYQPKVPSEPTNPLQ